MNTEGTWLERSIFHTVRYFDIFDMPVTATQIWRSLIVNPSGIGARWEGHALPQLTTVRQTLSESNWLQDRLGTKWGYFFLHGKDSAVVRRLKRHVIAQHKWKLTRRIVRLLAAVPLVRGIGVTGSLALSNTKRDSDLDLFFIVAAGRIWTARLLLLAVAQLTGRRRKYWDRRAPDKACLNHYISDVALAMHLQIRSLYTAVLFAHVIPLSGGSVFTKWREANEGWIKRWLMFPPIPLLLPRQAVHIPAAVRFLSHQIEAFLLEPVGNRIERWAEALQRRTIGRHTIPGRSGRIVLSDDELAFHPDSKAGAVLRQFSEEYGQRALL